MLTGQVGGYSVIFDEHESELLRARKRSCRPPWLNPTEGIQGGKLRSGSNAHRAGQALPGTEAPGETHA